MNRRKSEIISDMTSTRELRKSLRSLKEDLRNIDLPQEKRRRKMDRWNLINKEFEIKRKMGKEEHGSVL